MRDLVSAPRPTIFVSIASYRDPELLPTLQDAITKARHPEALRFGICWQHGPEESLDVWSQDPRFRILDIDWRMSRGACWARAEVMKLYAGEDYFLQLDSHHRFVEGWDEKLLFHLHNTGSEKPILSTYLPGFEPGKPDSFGQVPTQLDFDRFTQEGIILFRPSGIPDWESRTKPLRGRFLSGHFLFALGKFVEEVPYDPELYFTGEEITLSVRAFTHGWDVFQMPEVILWHEYTRMYRAHKHWTDHVENNDVELAWHQRDAASLKRVAAFLSAPHIGPLGLGTTRTFAEFEVFAGVDFRTRQAQDYTRDRLEPPNPPAPPNWTSQVAHYEFELPIARAMLPEGAEDAPFWFVGFHDASEVEIHRADCDAQELRTLLANGTETVRIRRSFQTTRVPASWLVWPHGKDGWLDRIRGEIHVQRPSPTTFVTALFDLGRAALSPAFARDFESHYLRKFEDTLAVQAPLVVYTEPALEAFVWARRRKENTRVVLITKAELEALPHHAPAQQIRVRETWRAQASWLSESPQAALPHYHTVVASKLRWLADVAHENPWKTRAFFWIDAGLSHTVDASLLADERLPRRLAEIADKPVFAAFSYRNHVEIHGFAIEAMQAHANTSRVDHVLRGGLFGGDARGLAALQALFDTWMKRTLSEGLMGTEESLFTLLAHRYPELLRAYTLGEDGLLEPFVRALLEGHPPPLWQAPSRALPSPSRTSGLYDEDLHGASVGSTRFMGLSMLQNRNTPAALQALWSHIEISANPLRRIVEIGTGSGGLSVLFALYAAESGAEFTTYDPHPQTDATPAFARLGIRQRKADVREPAVVTELAAMLQSEGRSLLVVDGVDHVGDVSRLADFLKPGDLVMVHDYAHSREVFAEAIRDRLWGWCEVTDADLAEVSARNGLEEVLPEVFHPAVWSCREKRGAFMRTPNHRPLHSTALYAISFNLPAQFQLWLESVERSDPEMLRGTDKILLDNSTDPSTASAYIALCAKYGFQRIAQGNLGITGGRIFCAQHFAKSPHDLMLYFEDDMLLAHESGVCRNGFPRVIDQLFAKLMRIMALDPELDFLKLSFSEVFGDHRVNWAAKNLDAERREAMFPTGDQTRVEALRSVEGVPYIVGEVHYSNWPLVITKRGNEVLFLESETLPPHEQGLMVRALELNRAGKLRGGVLLASPIAHQRVHSYGEGTRKES